MKEFVVPLSLGIAALVLVVGAFGTGTGDNPPAEDADDGVLLGEVDLAEQAEIWRNQYRRITPGDGSLVQDVGTLPAAWEEFSSVWDAAPAVRDLATWLVPFSAERDGAETILRDANGSVLWRGTTDFAKPESADVTLTGALVDELDWPLYDAAQAELAWRRTAETYREAGRPRLRDGEGGGTNNTPTNNPDKMFVSAVADFTTTPPEIRVGLLWTNDVTLDVFAYGPLHTSALCTITYTNDENQLVTTNVLRWYQVEPTLTGRFDNLWEYLGTVTLTNGEETVFVDTNYLPERWGVRYYSAFETGDFDNDGLNDAFETRILGTSTNSLDSDNDGISEWDEYHEYRTNPNDADTDHDLIDDLTEILNNTNPTQADTDKDGVGDAEDPMPAISNMWWVVTTSSNLFYQAYIDDRPSWPDVATSYGNWTWTFSTERPWSNAVVRDVTITGFVDDVIKIDGHEIDWRSGPKSFDHFSITNQIDDLQSGHFDVSLLDWPGSHFSGPNEVKIGWTSTEPFVVEWTWWIPFNVQMEPIWTTTSAMPLDNPSGIIQGSNAWFHVNVWPDNLFPVTNIVWTSLCGKVEIPAPRTGKRIQVLAAQEGPDDLQVEVVGAQGGDCLPPFHVQVKPLTVVPAVVGVVELVDGTNHIMASSAARVADAIASANRLLLQACLQIEWDGSIHTIQGTTANGYWNVENHSPGLTNLCSTLSCPGGLEFYFVNTIASSGDQNAAGLCHANGILISSNAHIRTLAHEIGHACGAKDIYVMRSDNMTLLSGNVREGWMEKDWGVYRNSSGWNPSQESIIVRLLMYGVSAPLKGDIPSGKIHGFRREKRFGSWKWFEGDAPCGLTAFTNTPISF